jgi:CDP-glucose 4,6-dehydratase
MLIDKMLSNGTTGEWNFGPDLAEKHSVSNLVQTFAKAWELDDLENSWTHDSSNQPHEAGYLLLDSSKARSELLWKDKLSFEQSIQLTVDWFKLAEKKAALQITINQIQDYLSIT